VLFIHLPCSCIIPHTGFGGLLKALTGLTGAAIAQPGRRRRRLESGCIAREEKRSRRSWNKLDYVVLKNVGNNSLNSRRCGTAILRGEELGINIYADDVDNDAKKHC